MDDFGKARSKFKKLAFDDSELVEADNSPDIVQPFDLDDLTRKRALTRTNTVKNVQSPLKSFSFPDQKRKTMIQMNKRVEFIDLVESNVN